MTKPSGERGSPEGAQDVGKPLGERSVRTMEESCRGLRRIIGKEKVRNLASHKLRITGLNFTHAAEEYVPHRSVRVPPGNSVTCTPCLGSN